MRKFLLVAVLLLLPVFVQAQPVLNPSLVIFTPSADHATVSAYDFGYFAVGATAPIQFASVAKGTLTPAGTDFSFPFPRLLFGGPFEHRMRACAPVSPPGTGTICSEWVLADKQANVSPFGPRAVRLGS